MSSPNILPDSRLSSTIGDVIADWPIIDEFGCRQVIRLCLQPIFCCNCGKSAGYVPRDVMSWVTWMCDPCALKWGLAASLHVSPDQEFWDAVAAEMQVKFGRFLTQHELNVLADQGRLGSSLEKLDRESPYRY